MSECLFRCACFAIALVVAVNNSVYCAGDQNHDAIEIADTRSVSLAISASPMERTCTTLMETPRLCAVMWRARQRGGPCRASPGAPSWRPSSVEGLSLCAWLHWLQEDGGSDLLRANHR